MLIGLSVQALPKMKSYRQSVVAERENHLLQRQFTQSQVVSPKYVCILCNAKCVQFNTHTHTITQCVIVLIITEEVMNARMGGVEWGEARVEMVRI